MIIEATDARSGAKKIFINSDKVVRFEVEEANRYKQDCTFCILATDICGLSHKLGLFDRKAEAESELNLLIDKMIFGSSRFVVCDEYES